MALLPNITRSLFRDDGTPKYVYYEHKDNTGRPCAIILNVPVLKHDASRTSPVRKSFPIEGRIVEEVWLSIMVLWLSALGVSEYSRNWEEARTAFIESEVSFFSRHKIETSYKRIFVHSEQ